MALLRPLIALAAVSLLFAAPASGANAGCGDTITQDTTLDSDVVGCPGLALIVNGDDVTLDLAGHTVQGGIFINEATDAVVENGTVEGGIEGRFAVNALIRDNQIRNASSGVALGRGSDGTIEDNLIEDNGVGVQLDHGGTSFLEDNVIRGNNTGIGVGIGSGVHAEDNVIALNAERGVSLTFTTGFLSDNLIARNGGPGVRAEDADLTLDDNRIMRNGESGVELVGAGPFLITDNKVDRNGANGIDLTGSRPGATVSGNHTWFNGELGIAAIPGTDGSRNWAKHNGNRLQCVNVSCSTKGKPKK